MDFDRDLFEQKEIRKTKLMQVVVTAIAIISLLLGLLSGESRFVLGVGLSVWAAIWAFRFRVYMPCDKNWQVLQRCMVGALGVVVVLSLFIFPHDPSCYTVWGGETLPAGCE